MSNRVKREVFVVLLVLAVILLSVLIGAFHEEIGIGSELAFLIALGIGLSAGTFHKKIANFFGIELSLENQVGKDN